MNRFFRRLRLFALWALLLTGCQAVKVAPPQGSVVRVVEAESGFQLSVDGEAFFVKGAAGHDHLDQLAAAGGNSIRTWGGDLTIALLDKANERDLKVLGGIWLAHERHGFDYSDEAKVAQQLERSKNIVLRFMHHPALLAWGVGNEMEWHPGTNVLVYKAVNDIAGMIKQVDPYHPTVTIISDIGKNGIKAKLVKEHCPNIDILGVNTYGGARSLPERLRAAGWTKPYMVTEFGPLGQWEVPKTDWGAEFEQSSHEKGEFYLETYGDGIASQPGWCLGSYVFNWGYKQEVTHTWYSMFTPEGYRYNPVDAMTYAWTGQWPTNQCPAVRRIHSKLSRKRVSSNTEYEALVEATDPDGDSLTFVYEVFSESKDKKEGGDKEKVPEYHPEAVVMSSGNMVKLRTPSEPGAYRLFVYAFDGQGNSATANTPFYVEPKNRR